MQWLEELEGYQVQGIAWKTARSTLYGARRRSDDAEVLLKVYTHDLTRSGESRTLRELATLEAIAGEGVPRTLGVIEGEGGSALVLERVPGISLDTWRTSAAPSIELGAKLALQLARILERIHGLHVVHGDLAPGNVSIDAAGERCWLLDFGAARPLGSSAQHLERHSAFASRAIDLHFIAPEQGGRMGRGIDTRSDLYSFGALLYFMLTGRPPFAGRDAMALIHAHMAVPPDPPETHRPELPLAIQQIVMRLLEKEPEERYPDAALLVADLESWCAVAGSEASDFVLPSRCRPTAPRLSARLVGRESELSALRTAVDRCAEASLDWGVIRGTSGMGKSALVAALGRERLEFSGYLASGKFDGYRTAVPYAGVKAAWRVRS